MDTNTDRDKHIYAYTNIDPQILIKIYLNVYT